MKLQGYYESHSSHWTWSGQLQRQVLRSKAKPGGQFCKYSTPVGM